MPWRRLLNRACRPQDMCLVYGLLWQNYVWKSLFLEKIRTLSACKDSWMEARLWPNVKVTLVVENEEVELFTVPPDSLGFDIFLTAFWQLSRGFFFNWPIKMPHARESDEAKVVLDISASQSSCIFLLSPPIDANRKLSKSRQNWITFSSGNQSVSTIPKGPIKKLLTLGQRL